MDLYLTEPVGPFHLGAGTTNNFTTKQNAAGATFTLPVIMAGKCRQGTKLRIRAQGDYSALTAAVLTLALSFGTRAGVVTGDFAAAAAFTCGTTPAAWPWWMEWAGCINTPPGTGATWLGMGQVQFGSALTTYNSETPIPVTAALRTTGAFDTTIERAIMVAATWGAASASNIITVNNLDALILN